jgi:hypothetical protein
MNEQPPLDEQVDYWEIPNNIDTSTFDFDWRPHPWEPPYIHQFGTKYRRMDGPRLVVYGATEIKYETEQIADKLVDDTFEWEIPQNIDRDSFDFTWLPDMFDEPFTHQFPSQHQHDGGPRLIVNGATKIKYENCQVAKAIPIMSNWEIPPNINCDKFDFSWHPQKTERPYVYQFGTQHQRTGGPRYIQPGARRTKYVDTQQAVATPTTDKWVIDSDVEVIEFDFSWHPDATDILSNYAFNNSTIVYTQGPGLPLQYRNDDRAIIKLRPLDIIFLSNGETGEQERYNRLCQAAGREVRWVRGIDGRENAIRHAAEISNTSYFILFPAKIWASDTFDYNFQPNRSYEPKHYIFYSTNPLNGLEYGHQAAVCYNRNLVLDTHEYGLDFTMSKLHDIVPISCGIAQYNSDITMTWRTAFREVIKLRADGSEESLERLRVWLTYARGQHAEWSIIGAQDGINYYDSVGGDHQQLMKTFAWSWLRDYFAELHPDML